MNFLHYSYNIKCYNKGINKKPPLSAESKLPEA